MNKKVESLKIHCFSCQSTNHLMLDCPLIHYIPNKYIVINRYVAPVRQDRKADIKRKNLRYNGRGHLIKIQSIAMAFIKDHDLNKEDSESSKVLSNSESSDEPSSNEKGFELKRSFGANKAQSNKNYEEKEIIDGDNKKRKENEFPNKIRHKYISIDNFYSFPLKPFEKENYLISAKKIGIGSNKNSKEEDLKKVLYDFRVKNFGFSESVENMDKIKNFKFYFVENNFEEIAKRYKKKRATLKNLASPTFRKQKKK